MAPKRHADEHMGSVPHIRGPCSQRKFTLKRHLTYLRSHASLQGLPIELRLQIWKHLLVSSNTVTPRYRVCYDCGRKRDSERRAAQHTYDCVWDPQLSLNLYPNILQTCQTFYEDGIDLLYTKNRFTNLCQDADATAAYFFQSIGEDNACRIQSYTLRWPDATPGPALIYLSHLPNLQNLTIEGFDEYRTTKGKLQWLSRIRAKNIQWRTLQEGKREEYSNLITSTVAKQKPKLTWASIVS
jgi:hypothetical protein